MNQNWHRTIKLASAQEDHAARLRGIARLEIAEAERDGEGPIGEEILCNLSSNRRVYNWRGVLYSTSGGWRDWIICDDN